MNIALVESPYAGNTPEEVKRNILYARIACRWALMNEYAPFASHLFYTQPGILDDDVPEERTLGIDAGLLIGQIAAHTSLFFMDYGESRGMVYGRENADIYRREVEDVYLFDGFLIETYDQLLAAATKLGHIKQYSRKGW